MPRQRIYASDAQRQAAYRQRLAHQRSAAGEDAEMTLAETRRALGVAQRRADRAETKIGALEATVADLRRQLATTGRHTAPADHTAPERPVNRAQRRRAQRQQPRPR